MILRYISPRLLSATCLVGVCLAASTAMAQSSMFGSGSVSNRNSMGGMTSPSSGFSGMGGGLGGMGGGLGGIGGMGGGLGGMGGGFGGMGGNSGFGGMGGMGNSRGGMGTGGFGNNAQSGFVGRNVNPNQFIGMNQNTGGNTQGMGGLQSMFGGQGGNRGLGGLGGRGGNPTVNNFDQNQNNSNQNQQQSLRARQKIAFTYTNPRTTGAAGTVGIHTHVQQRFGKLTERNVAMKNVQFATEGSGTVVLRGEVASRSDARLAEKLVRLEPGVKSVRSELTFPAPTADE